VICVGSISPLSQFAHFLSSLAGFVGPTSLNIAFLNSINLFSSFSFVLFCGYSPVQKARSCVRMPLRTSDSLALVNAT
jgi:hypothetical protein